MHWLTSANLWLASHPIWFSMILFLLSALISIYGGQIKSFLHTWPIRTLRTFNLNTNINRLALLESLNNNTYKLVIYLASQFTSVVTVTLNLWILLNVYLLFFSRAEYKTNFLPLLFGVAVGKASQLQFVLIQLSSYDRSTQDLRRYIEHKTLQVKIKHIG